MEEDDTRTCQFYVSIDQPECGRPGAKLIKVRTALITAKVMLCGEHAALHSKRAYEYRRAAEQRAAQEVKP